MSETGRTLNVMVGICLGLFLLGTEPLFIIILSFFNFLFRKNLTECLFKRLFTEAREKNLFLLTGENL